GAILTRGDLLSTVADIRAEALNTRAALRAAEPVFGVPAAADVPVFAPRASGLAALWLGLTCAQDPFTLGPAQSTTTELRAAVSFPSAEPNLLDVRVFGTLRVRRPPLVPRRELPGRELPRLDLPRAVIGALRPAARERTV